MEDKLFLPTSFHWQVTISSVWKEMIHPRLEILTYHLSNWRLGTILMIRVHTWTTPSVTPNYLSGTASFCSAAGLGLKIKLSIWVTIAWVIKVNCSAISVFEHAVISINHQPGFKTGKRALYKGGTSGCQLRSWHFSHGEKSPLLIVN